MPQVAEWAFRARERELLTWFFWRLSHNEAAVSPAHFEEYVRQISKPGALRAGIENYASVWQDSEDNKALAQASLDCPVLAIGGKTSAGAWMPELFKLVARNVTGPVIPAAGHWLADENPKALSDAMLNFFTAP